jgi:hypothetical protein
MSKIFGGSKSKSQQTSTSSSNNLAYQPIQQGYMPEATNAFQSGARALQLGLAGGYDKYRENTGADFWEQLGLRKTAGGFSGRGLYNTGATMKALTNYGTGIQSASYNDYLAQQAKLAELGIGGGNLVAGAGQVSNSQSQGTSVSKQSNGMGGFIGNIIGAAAASDERLKTDITRLGEHSGLGVYEFTYINGAGPYIGVMAQEVAEKYPEALGPEREGYLTVDYNKLQELTGSFKNDFSN